MYELLDNFVKQSDEDIMTYIKRRDPIYFLGEPIRSLLEPWIELINAECGEYITYDGIVHEFDTINRNGRLYKEYDPFISGQRLFILQPPKSLFDLWIDFLNDTKQLSIYRLRKTNELLKEVPTIHINGGVIHAIEVSKNKYEQTQRSRKNGVSSYGRSRPFWS